MMNKIFEVFSSKVFFLFYYTLALIIYVICIPYLFFQSFKPKYKDAISARFGLIKNTPFKNRGIWFHCCSMGETKAIRALVNSCRETTSISVITNTGFEEANSFCDDVRFLPFEIFLPFWIKRHSVLVVMEAELWFVLFFIAKAYGIKTMLINARISDKSNGTYQKFRWFYKQIFCNIDYIFAQNESDARRLELLGGKNIQVIGNIKIANLPTKTKHYNREKEWIIVAASTHHLEEEWILQAYEPMQNQQLIVVPRHPERFEDVDKLMQNYAKQHNISYSRYSQQTSMNSDIILFDQMGELNNIYAMCDVVILGGSFVNVGGHNPIEPAYFNKVLISGKNIFNQKALFECVNNYYLIDNIDLRDYLSKTTSLQKASIMKQGDIKPILEVLNGKSI